MKKINLPDIAAWPTPLHFLSVVALAVLVWLVVWQGRLADQQSVRSETVSQLEALQQAYLQKAQMYLRLKVLDKDRQNLSLQKDALLEQLPDAAQVPAVIEQLTQVSAEQGLQLVSLELGEESTHPLYKTLSFKLKLRGSYHAVSAFFSALAVLSTPVTLHDFQIEPVQSGTLLQLLVHARAYHLAAPL